MLGKLKLLLLIAVTLGLLPVNVQAADGKWLRKLNTLVNTNKIALAYTYVNSENSKLSADEKENFLSTNMVKIDALMLKLKPQLYLNDTDVALDRALASQLEKAITVPVVMGPASTSKSLYPVELQVKVVNKDIPSPHIIRSEHKSSRYLAGQRQVDNPAKRQCQDYVRQARQNYEDMVRDRDNAQSTYEACEQSRAYNKYAICLPPIVNNIGLAVVEGKNNELEQQCNDVPYTIAQDDYQEKDYEHEYWGMDPSITIEVTLVDVGHKKALLITKQLSYQFHVEGDKVNGNQRYNIADKPLSLPSSSKLEENLYSGVLKQVSEVVVDGLAQMPTAIENEAQLAKGNDRLEILARLLFFSESLGVALPNRAETLNEITTSIKL